MFRLWECIYYSIWLVFASFFLKEFVYGTRSALWIVKEKWRGCKKSSFSLFPSSEVSIVKKLHTYIRSHYARQQFSIQFSKTKAKMQTISMISWNWIDPAKSLHKLPISLLNIYIHISLMIRHHNRRTDATTTKLKLMVLSQKKKKRDRKKNEK